MTNSQGDSQHPGGRLLCPTCWHWQGALDLPTGSIGQLHACIRGITGAGSRTECSHYDLDPMRARIEFIAPPKGRR